MVTNISVTLTDDERRRITGTNRPASRKEVTDLVLAYVETLVRDGAPSDPSVPKAEKAPAPIHKIEFGVKPDEVMTVGDYALHRYVNRYLLYRKVSGPGPDRFIDEFKSEAEARSWIAEGV